MDTDYGVISNYPSWIRTWMTLGLRSQGMLTNHIFRWLARSLYGITLPLLKSFKLSKLARRIGAWLLPTCQDRITICGFPVTSHPATQSLKAITLARSKTNWERCFIRIDGSSHDQTDHCRECTRPSCRDILLLHTASRSSKSQNPCTRPSTTGWFTLEGARWSSCRQCGHAKTGQRDSKVSPESGPM